MPRTAATSASLAARTRAGRCGALRTRFESFDLRPLGVDALGFLVAIGLILLSDACYGNRPVPALPIEPVRPDEELRAACRARAAGRSGLAVCRSGAANKAHGKRPGRP